LKRLDSVLLIAVTLVASWLGMQAVHEAGHVLGAWTTGAQVERVVLHPLAISRTDVSHNCHPLFVTWMGPLLGVAAPVALWVLAEMTRMPGTFVPRFFTGFCLIANGGYLAFGSLQRIGDCGTLLRHGAPLWSLILFGAVAMPLGLLLWNGTGPDFGLGPQPRAIDRRLTIAVAVVAAALVILGLSLPS
jgi:hypothetical protein